MNFIKLDNSGCFIAAATGSSDVASLYFKDGFIEGNPPPDVGMQLVNGAWVLPNSVIFNRVKEVRNKLLLSSDWTQLPDVPLATKEAWATYRQALRDITLQTDPANTIWPTKPS